MDSLKVPPASRIIQAHITAAIGRDRMEADPFDSRGEKLLYILPACLFSIFKLRGGRQQQRRKSIQARAGMFRRGEWEQLWENVSRGPEESLSRPPPTLVETRAKVLKHIAAGNLAKARRAINPAGFIPGSRDIATRLQSLHPSSSSPDPDTIRASDIRLPPSFQLDRDVYNKTLARLPRGSAPGPSGWRYEDLVDLCREGGFAAEWFFQHFSKVARAVSRSQGTCSADASPFWSSASIIALEKDSGGIRPIALPEVFRKFLSRTMLSQARSAVRKAVGERQFGVQCPTGLEAIITGTRILLEGNRENCLLKLDVSNAFNSFRRDIALDLVEANPDLAHLGPFLRLVYSGSSTLLYELADGETVPIFSQTGSHQGDPLSPLLFSLVHSAAMDKVRSLFPVGFWDFSYVDDTYIVSPIDQIPRILEEVKAAFAEVGLMVNMDKSSLFSQQAVDDTVSLVVPITLEGLMVVGAPVGTDTFVLEKTRERLFGSYSAGLDFLAHLEDPQSAYKLLRDSYLQRASFLSRVSNPKLCADLFKEYDQFMWSITTGFLQLDGLNLADDSPSLISAKEQAFMPVRLGGLGLRSLHIHSPSAYLAATIEAGGLLEFLPEAVTFFSSVSNLLHLRSSNSSNPPPSPPPPTSPLREALVDAYFELPRVVQVRVPEFTSGTLKSQHLLSHLLDDYRFASFRRAQPLDASKARLLSVSGHGAGAWLNATPNSPSKILAPGRFISAVCKLLNLPQPYILDAMVALEASSNLPTRAIRCGLGVDISCGETVSVEGQHYGLCKNSNLVHFRHSVIMRILKDGLEEAGFSVSKENTSIYPPQIVGDGPSFRKMDLVAIAPDAGNEAPATALCIDVSVVDATAPSYGPRRETLRPGSRGGLSAATTRLYAAGLKVKVKRATYSDTPAPYSLVPFILEANGAFSNEAKNLLKTIVKRTGHIKGRGQFRILHSV